MNKLAKYNAPRSSWNAKDLNVGRLGSVGISYKAMSQATGLTKSQIRSRLKKLHIKLSNYRDGQSKIAQFVIKATLDITEREITRRVRELEGKNVKVVFTSSANFSYKRLT